MRSTNPLMFTVDSIDFMELSAEPHDSNKIVEPRSYREQTIAYLNGSDKMTGAVLPWPKTHAHLQFRPGEVSLWMGVNGHGKSLVTSQVALGFLHQEQKALICSFEMKPQATLARTIRQAASSPVPTERFVDAVLGHATGKLWLYDRMGQTDPDHLMKIMRYASRKLGINHFFVDSLMKVVKGEDDYNGQKAFVDKCCEFAQDMNTHVHIIHHSRKLADENQIPGKMDAKGSGAIVDQVDQCFTVWRNKRKEQQRQRNDDKFNEDEPDALIVCDKNRHGDWEGRIGLYYIPGAASYSEAPKRPMQYDYNAYMEVAGVEL